MRSNRTLKHIILASTITLITSVMTTDVSAQKQHANIKTILNNTWLTDEILKDTINLTRVHAFTRYDLLKTLKLQKRTGRINYNLSSKPRRNHVICGNGILDVDPDISNFRILNNQHLLIELYASMDDDMLYTYHYVKEFRCERISKNRWQLIVVNTISNKTAAFTFSDTILLLRPLIEYKN